MQGSFRGNSGNGQAGGFKRTTDNLTVKEGKTSLNTRKSNGPHFDPGKGSLGASAVRRLSGGGGHKV